MQSVGLLHWGGGTFPGGVQICYLLPPFLIFPGLFLAFPCHTGIPCWQTSLRKLPSHEVKDAMSVLRERNHHLRASDLQLQPQVSLYLPCTPKPPPGLVAPLTGSGWEIGHVPEPRWRHTTDTSCLRSLGRALLAGQVQPWLWGGQLNQFYIT